MGLPRLIALAALLILSGCITAEEQRAADRTQCRDYGYRPNSEAFAECMERTDSRRETAQQLALDRINRDNERTIVIVEDH